jgi:hypothetical protein
MVQVQYTKEQSPFFISGKWNRLKLMSDNLLLLAGTTNLKSTPL